MKARGRLVLKMVEQVSLLKVLNHVLKQFDAAMKTCCM